MSSADEKPQATVRQLSLRDALWRTFELMSEEQEKSVDDLVNDAMTSYAQLAGYETTGNREGVSAVGVTPVSTAPAGGGGISPLAGAAGGAPGRLNRPGGALFAPPIPGPVPVRMGRSAAVPPLPSSSSASSPGSGASVSTHPPALPGPPPVEGLAAGHATLFLLFDHQRYRIDKDQFIIGRGSKSSDLSIKDGNISRKHAAVIRRNATYFIKDLGSTNGIDFKGMRIDNKRIDEGDVFYICEYELKFTYKR